MKGANNIMKNIFLKLNMAIIFVVVLFASVSFANKKTDDLVSYLQENLNIFDGRGLIGDSHYEEAGNVEHMRAMISLDTTTLDKLKKDGIEIRYGIKNDEPYLIGKDTNTKTTVTIMVSSKNGNKSYGFIQSINDLGVKTSTGENIAKNEMYYIDNISDGKEIILTDLVSQMGSGQALFFAVNYPGDIPRSDINFKFENGSNTNVISSDDIATSEKYGVNADIWQLNGEIKIDENKCKIVDNKWMYSFKALNQGTYEIYTTLNNNKEEYDTGIYRVETRDGVTYSVPGGAPEKKGDFSTSKNKNVVLVNGTTYFWYFDIDSNVTITYKWLHDGIANQIDANIPDSNLEEASLFDQIEKVMSDFVLSIARVINWLVSWTVGENVTIDSIVFNEYSDARLEFFTTDIHGNEVETSSNLIKDMRTPVANIYSIFRNLALIGYLAILIYIGIKMMLDSTTAQKKASYKETFLTWVTGLVILFFMPYYMKYVIALNDGFVTYIRENENIRSPEAIAAKPATIDTDNGFIYTDFESAIGEGTDYMSSLYSLANYHGRLGISIAYLVLSWQVIMLVVYYYKRAFIVALLIIIFPLIAFSFVWDKLNDGKSQALSAWTKEFTIDVLVQTFHAIVFAFVCNTIYSSVLTGTGATGATSVDFILLMIASSFLFQGESILKQIFGGGGDSLGSAAQTGIKIAAITRITSRVVGRTVNNVVGESGAVRTGWRSLQGLRRDRELLKKIPDGNGGKTTAFDILSSNPARDRRVNELLPTEGDFEKNSNIRKAAETIDTLNNMDKNTAQKNAEALKTYKELLDGRNGKGPRAMTSEEMKQFDAMMRKSNLTKEQLDKIDTAMLSASTAYMALGSNPSQKQVSEITKKLRLEIEAILPAPVDADGNKLTGKKNVKADNMMAAALYSIQEKGISANRKTEMVEESFENTFNRTKNAAEKIKFATEDDVRDFAIAGDRRKKRADALMQKYEKSNPSITKAQATNSRVMARDVALVEQAFSDDKKDVVTAKQVARAMKNIESNRELADAMIKYSRLDRDIDGLRYILAKKMTTTDTSVSTTDVKVRDAVERRVNYIVRQYKDIYKDVSPEEENNVDRIARQIANLEFIGTGVESNAVDDQHLRTRLDNLNAEINQDMVNSILKLSHLETDIDSLRILLNSDDSRYMEWASDIVNQVEEESSRRAQAFEDGSAQESDPYSSILEIIEAAKKGSPTGKIENLDDLFIDAAKPEANREILERKRNLIRNQNQEELLKSSEFAKQAIRLEGYEYRKVNDFRTNPNISTTLDNNSWIGNDMSIARNAVGNVWQGTKNTASNIRRAVSNNILEEKKEYEQPTFEGYTYDEIRQRKNDNALSFVNSVLGVASDIAFTPATTLAGAAIGAAITDDGMPIEESFTGAMGGFNLGTSVSDKFVNKLTSEDKRAQERAAIQSKIAKRINAEEKARLKAQDAYQEAAAEAKSLDNTLIISGANANLHIESDGTLSATVSIMATNAAYMSVDETPIIPSSGWEPFAESYYYVFKDKNPKANHNLYIYVRDKDGNIKGMRIEGIHE